MSLPIIMPIERSPKKIQMGLLQAEESSPQPEGRIWMIADENPPRPRIVRPGMYQIWFEVKNGLSMALVRESDVPVLEGMTAGCCGRPRKHIYRRATGEEIVRHGG